MTLDGAVLFELGDRTLQAGFVFLREFLTAFNGVDEISVVSLQVLTHGTFYTHGVGNSHVIIVAVIDCIQNERLFPNLQRLILAASSIP